MDNISTEVLFEKFEIIGCLKKDTQAGVYLANHIFLGKKILLKTLNTDGLSDKTILERFKREAKILAQLDHPNLIKVLDFGMFNNFFYISFEYFESRNLREVIANNHLSPEEKKHLIIQLLEALKTAHQNQIIHRDIKPENILVNSQQELKIADFGLALVINENNVTNTSTIVGTPSYMAPEQIRGEKTHQTDIFSAGLVAFELYTGKNPVLGSAMGETINNILNFNIENYSADIQSFPEEIQNAIKIMLHNNLSRRAKSAEEVLSCLGVKETKRANLIKEKSDRKKKINLTLSLFFLVILISLGIIVGKTWLFANHNVPVQSNKAELIKNNPLQTKNNSDEVKQPVDKKNDIKLEDNTKTNHNKNVEVPPLISNKDNTVLLPGKLSIDSYPWAQVYIDNKIIDNTPLKNITLAPGKHELKLLHPDYPAYTQMINIISGKIDSLFINIDDLVGFLKCDVYPWGKVFINGKLVGTTPLDKPIVLSPGNYTLTVENEKFSPVSKEVTISAKKTVEYKLNFDELSK